MVKLLIEDEKIISEWDYEKNSKIGLDPSKLVVGSSKKAWWICKNGHSFQAVIFNRSKKGTGCPYCSNYYVLKGFNDLKTRFPELAKEFDEKRNGLMSNEVLAGGEKKYWWICPQGHSYQASMNRRTKRGNGCPYCSGHRVYVGFNNFFIDFPHLEKEWDYKKNKGINPNDYSKGSSKKVYWICSHGHSYQTTILSRCSGRNCPVCSSTKLLSGVNDLATINPKLASEWHPTKNGKVTPSDIFSNTGVKYWWLCSHGHEWRQSPHLRSKGRGCPICSKEIHVSFPEKVFYYYLSKVFCDALENYNPGWNSQRNLDIYIPEYKIGIEFDGVRWHKDISSDLIKNKLCREHNILLIRIREKGCPQLADSSFDFVFDNDYKKAFEFIKRIIKEKYKIDIQFEIDIDRDRAIINESVLSSEKRNNITETNPEVLEEWDYSKNGFLRPEFLTKGSTRKVWWVCSKGHSWLASVSNRCRLGRRCPYCFGNRIIEEDQSIAVTNKDILVFWDYNKNIVKPKELRAGSGKKVWWVCEHGHSFEKTIRDMVKNTGCPICDDTILIPGKNDLATRYPSLLLEWDYDKNKISPSDVKPGSSLKVWWICKKGHSYQSKIQSRTSGHNCPICFGRKIVSGYNDLATLYPEIAGEFDEEKNYPLKIDSIGSKVTTKVWWKCSKCGYEWQARINWRTSGHNCPKCETVKKHIL